MAVQNQTKSQHHHQTIKRRRTAQPNQRQKMIEQIRDAKEKEEQRLRQTFLSFYKRNQPDGKAASLNNTGVEQKERTENGEEGVINRQYEPIILSSHYENSATCNDQNLPSSQVFPLDEIYNASQRLQKFTKKKRQNSMIDIEQRSGGNDSPINLKIDFDGLAPHPSQNQGFNPKKKSKPSTKLMRKNKSGALLVDTFNFKIRRNQMQNNQKNIDKYY